MLTSSTAYQSAVYADIRQFDARITFTINNQSTVYDDSYITQLNVVEETSVLNDSIPSNEVQVTLDNTSGAFNFLNLSNMNQIIASRPKIFVELGLHITGGVEWQPMGVFYVDSWKNDFGALTVTLIGHDNFMMMDNIAYNVNVAGLDLYSIADGVFITAGIIDFYVDPSLKSITTTTGFNGVVTCRQALQHIAIASMSVVYQDRNGTMRIEPFISIDKNDNYINYPGSNMGLYSGFDPFEINAYSKLNDGNGMKRLDFNNNFSIPQVALDRSINQLVIKVYSSVNTSTDYIVNNPEVNVSNGVSFTIDNPLINDNTTAQNVANWYINESNHNVIYTSDWRGNPILETADIVIVSNGLNNDYAKQARIFKQEFQYQGYLTCNTESRGGL